jgi:hypothetical protein
MSYKLKSPKLKEKKTFEIEKEKSVYINGHYYSWEEENGKVKISLGNLSEAGWYWNGDKKSFISYLHRIENSKTRDSFLQDVKKENINFDKKVKPYLYESAKTKDGLYEMSGDNVRWHFGEDLMDSYDIKEEYELTDKQADEFWIKYSGLTYEQFQRKYGKEYQQDIDKAISESHSFEEFMEKTNELKEKYNGLADEETLNEAEKTARKIKK